MVANDAFAHHARSTRKWKIIAAAFFVLSLWNNFFETSLCKEGFWISATKIEDKSKLMVSTNSSLDISSTRSTTSSNITVNKTLPPCIKPLPVKWEWNYYSRNENNTQPRAKKRLLIGLYAGFDKFAEMLERTAVINKAYAKKWNHDLVVLQGTAFVVPEVDGNCSPGGFRVVLNKISLLREALALKEDYDQFLLLDSDAIMYGFDTDVTALLPDEYMLSAHRVASLDEEHTWNINNGVTLWNLHHIYTPVIVMEWSLLAQETITNDTQKRINDQVMLHRVLRNGNFRKQVWSSRHAFKYDRGEVVRHFIRLPEHFDWNKVDVVRARDDRIKNASMEVCETNFPICDQVERISYSDPSKW